MVKFKSIDEVVHKFAGNNAIICADTCVLLQMVRVINEENFIHQLDTWLSQMQDLKKILRNSKIGWVIPEQVNREFINNTQFSQQTKEQAIETLEKRLTGKSHINDRGLNNIHDGINKKINKLGELIGTNRQNILDKSLIMQEDKGDFVHHAWERVWGDKFPNQSKKNQQMKDSVILYHLLELKEKLKNTAPQIRVCFWTFDSFDGHQPRDTFPPADEWRVTQNTTRIEIFDNVTKILPIPLANLKAMP